MRNGIPSEERRLFEDHRAEFMLRECGVEIGLQACGGGIVHTKYIERGEDVRVRLLSNFAGDKAVIRDEDIARDRAKIAEELIPTTPLVRTGNQHLFGERIKVKRKKLKEHEESE